MSYMICNRAESWQPTIWEKKPNTLNKWAYIYKKNQYTTASNMYYFSKPLVAVMPHYCVMIIARRYIQTKPEANSNHQKWSSCRQLTWLTMYANPNKQMACWFTLTQSAYFTVFIQQVIRGHFTVQELLNIQCWLNYLDKLNIQPLKEQLPNSETCYYIKQWMFILTFNYL